MSSKTVKIYDERRLAEIARAALTLDNYVRKPGMCQVFVRQCIQQKYHKQFDKFFYLGTANNTAKMFSISRYAVKGDLQDSDVLYWYGTTFQTAGHTGIYSSMGRVYENSIVHWSDVSGAKSFRYLNSMRKPDVIVRLPR